MLMIDNGWAIKWDVSTAVKRCIAFDEYDVSWVEEPLGGWDPEGYRTLRDKTRTLIAYGEKEWTLDGFERVLATGTVDVVGVDPGRAEGITGFKRVADRVDFYKRQSNAHAWSSRSSRPRASRCRSATRRSSSSSSSRSATRCSTSW
jgi:L-alanine-DL-glutamate epimerase-like enolase superfamily enzyme